VILTGLRRAEGESRLQERAVAADHRVIIIAGPILTSIRVSYVTPSFGCGTVYSVEAALG
jgi:hypothetical protein